MIIVTGTKRSGTSMWMQLLQAAGFPPIGDAFPRTWGETIRDANPQGFYESELRKGIYYATNPHPKTGDYLFPEQTRHHAVKVFVPGLIRTDRAFIDKVIATVRPWRQYVRSVTRLYEMEKASKAEKRSEAAPALPDPVYLPPALEWWMENFSLVSDIVTRRYPVFMVAYESVVNEPRETLDAVLSWVGECDVDAAVAQVNPELRTQGSLTGSEDDPGEVKLEADVIEVFDELHETVRAQRPLEQAFVDRLNEINQVLSDPIAQAMRAFAKRQQERKQALLAAKQK